MVTDRKNFIARLRVNAARVLFALALLSNVHCASASVVLIEDTFTAANNTALIGRFASPTDVPAIGYSGNGNVSLVGGITGGTPYEADIQANAARVGGDAGAGLNLGVSTAEKFELTITFNVNADTGTQLSDPHRGAALGFFSSVNVASGGSSHGFNNFTGLTVDRAGSVRLIIGGTDSGVFASMAGFNPAVNHTLTYRVDTAVGVGSLSNIVLDGTSVALTAPVNTFSIARAAYAGFYNSSSGSADVAIFDDFSVAIVPEPSALVVAAVVLPLAILHHRHLIVRRARARALCAGDADQSRSVRLRRSGRRTLRPS
jgi:hypothetical protein